MRLLEIVSSTLTFNYSRLGYVIHINFADWNKDFKPAPLPKTEEERRAAAAKYNLHPAEYQTYPDDGSGLGDYPKLPDISAENKDPFYPWDMPEIKKNFNEPVCIESLA